MLVYSSFTAGAGKLPFEAHGLTLANYVHMLTDAQTYELLWTTALFTVGSTTIGIAVAVLFAWLIERTDLWLRQLFFVAILIPMAIPNMIYAMAWIQLLDPNNGLLNTTLEQVGLGLSAGRYLLAGRHDPPAGHHAGFARLSSDRGLLSHARRLVGGAELHRRPAAVGHDARGSRSPMLKPALLAAALFFTIVAMETFDIPVTLGMTSRVHVLSTQIYWSTRPETGQLPGLRNGERAVDLLVVIARALIHFYQRQMRSAKHFVTVTGRGYRRRRVALGRWRFRFSFSRAVFITFAVMRRYSC